MSKPKWQTLTDGEIETTEVLRVPGGRLYRTILMDPKPSGPLAVALVFQRDEPEHSR